MILDMHALSCAKKEAEMVECLVGVTPLIGYKATRQTVLRKKGLTSLIHFAAHSDTEREDIAPFSHS